jgi:hypothetical protein
LNRRRRKREAQLRAMSPEEREASLRRSKAMKPRSLAEARQRREAIAQRRRLSREVEDLPPTNPATLELELQIAELESRLEELKQEATNDVFD